MRAHLGATSAAVLLVLTACGGPAQDTTGSPTPNPAVGSSQPTDDSTQLRSPPVMTTPIPVTALYPSGDIDASLQPYIDTATADLAGLLGVSPSDVTTHAAVLVIWPDRSLGCPAKDMRYPQVPTDGSIIELQHAGKVYRYHTGGTRGPFQCATPLSAAPTRTGQAPTAEG